MSKIHINIPLELYNELFTLSIKKGITMTSIVIEALRDRLCLFPTMRADNDDYEGTRRYE